MLSSAGFLVERDCGIEVVLGSLAIAEYSGEIGSSLSAAAISRFLFSKPFALSPVRENPVCPVFGQSVQASGLPCSVSDVECTVTSLDFIKVASE